MKSMHAHQLHRKEIEKTMAQDDQEFLEYEAQQYDRHSTRKIQPAYMQNDAFEDKKIESEQRRLHTQYVERQREGRHLR
jgi:hypothetical protein